MEVTGKSSHSATMERLILTKSLSLINLQMRVLESFHEDMSGLKETNAITLVNNKKQDIFLFLVSSTLPGAKSCAC